ncbi:hypothetical protein HA402_001259 [Bradysia odoriphaga]|nr:hypothetical protein HA402_001259 [Bradysia odoriphaga]
MNSAPEKSYQIGKGPMGASVVAQLSSVHPLKSAEENHEQSVFERDMQMLRKFEGLHAPLKLAMERHAFKTVGRLACLPSSNAHLDVLSGRDEMIDFTDFLGGAEYSEKLTNPHAVVAKSLNIL